MRGRFLDGPYCRPERGTRLFFLNEWPMVACNASRCVWSLFLLPQYYPLYRPITSRVPGCQSQICSLRLIHLSPSLQFTLSMSNCPGCSFLVRQPQFISKRTVRKREETRTHLSSPSSSSQPFNNFRCPSSGQARSER